jgi:ribosomal protein S18 acetylase RimI-like enzyme
LHGKQLIDGKLVVYNGGTGVIPENRKSGWVREMYDLILPVLKEQGAEKLVLEVITENVPAIKSYEKFGYTVSRKLKCYRGDINIKAVKKDAEIREVADFGWAK